MKMFDKIRRLFASWRKKEPEDFVNLQEIYDELQELILQNQLQLISNESLILKIETALTEEKAKILLKTNNDFNKRCILRKIASYRSRLTRLTNCSSIYNDNIKMQTQVSERVEDMRVSGLKTITAETLEEISLDSEEMYAKHREAVKSADLIGANDYEPDETYDNDPELKKLAEECGLL